MPKFKDLAGMRFGKLVAIERTENSASGATMWKCKCDCGKEKNIRSGSLLAKRSKSCGCPKFGVENCAYKHGLTNTKILRVYHSMIQRCYNPKDKKYKDYGARGVTVFDEWLGKNGSINFCGWVFENGYKEEPLPNGRNKWEIERKDVNGNYCPENCCFITNKQQQSNKRNNHYITYNNETLTLSQWAEKLNINCSLLGQRISKLNWSIEKALTTPVRMRAKK